jgi:hypothetical protein
VRPPPEDPSFRFAADDRARFDHSLDALEAEVEAFLGGSPTLPNEDARRRRWSRFAAACLETANREARDVLTTESLRAAYDSYLATRSVLLGSGQPAALADLAHAGVPLAYMLHDAGGVKAGRLLLGDLLTLQMRLVLQPRSGPALWRRDLLCRETLLYAIEHGRLDVNAPQNKANGGAAAPYWGVSIPCAHWVDLLQARVGDGWIHKDVLTETESGDQQALLWNLQLQLDQWAGRGEVLSGFVAPGFQPGREFTGRFAEKFGPSRR